MSGTWVIAGTAIYTCVLTECSECPNSLIVFFLFTNGRNKARSRTSHCRGPCSGNLPAKIPQGAL